MEQKFQKSILEKCNGEIKEYLKKEMLEQEKEAIKN